MLWKSHVHRAIECAGSQEALARLTGISQSNISKLVRTTGDFAKSIKAEHAVAIEKATNGVVTRVQLRPDIFNDMPAAVGQ